MKASWFADGYGAGIYLFSILATVYIAGAVEGARKSRKTEVIDN